MRRTLLTALVMVFIAAFVSSCGKYGTRYTGETEVADSGTGARLVSQKPFDEAAKKKAGCTDLVEYESEGREHSITSLDQKGTYLTNPPTSGNHYAQAQEWGIYDEQQLDVKSTHSLEHGIIVISYYGISDDDLKTLIRYVKRDPWHILVQPREDNPKEGEDPDAEATTAEADGKADEGDKPGIESPVPGKKPDDSPSEARPAESDGEGDGEGGGKKAASPEVAKSGDDKSGDEKSGDDKKPEKAKVKKGIWYSVWTAQMFCERPSAEALQFMIDEWRDQGPELFSTDPSMDDI